MVIYGAAIGRCKYCPARVVLCPVFVPGNVLQYLALKSGCSEFWISAAYRCLIILVTWRAIQCQLGVFPATSSEAEQWYNIYTTA